MYKCIDLNGHAIGLCSQTPRVETTIHVKLTNLEGLILSYLTCNRPCHGFRRHLDE